MNYPLDKTEFTIQGQARTETDDRNRILVDGTEILPELSQKIRNHSPDGFNWGYGGSGPAQTALAICLHIFDDTRLAQVFYQAFKRDFVAAWQPAGEDFTIKIDITAFLADHHDLIKREEESQVLLKELAGEEYETE